MSSLWSKFGVAIIALLAFLALVPALQSGLAVFRRLLKGRARGPSRAAGVSLSRHFRFIVLLVFTVGLIYHGSTKSNGRMAVQRLRAEAPVVQTNDVAAAWSAAERAPGYVLAATGTTVATDFAAPATALHLARWVPGGRSDDFMAVPCPFTNLIVGINGTLTTAHRRLDKFPFPVTNALVVAPAFATNGLIPGVGEFWFTTNAAAARYVWRNIAYERSASNLVSFAVTYCHNRDLIFEYGPAFPSNTLSVLQNGTNILRLTTDRGAVAEPIEFLGVNFFPFNRSFKFSFIAGLGDGTGDLDADGVSNYNEVMLYGTDPRSADTDQDNLADGAELAAGTDPRSFDTDGDGLADSLDPAPLASNGNCYGQSTNWVAAVYGTNAAAIIAQGYTNYVADTVANDANDWWYSFTVTVSNFDASGHAFVRVGDQAVILARPESGAVSATFLLKRGQRYDIHVVPAQDSAFTVSPESIFGPEFGFRDGTGFVFWHPLFEITPDGCHYGTSTLTWSQEFVFLAHDVHPSLVGSGCWVCDRPDVAIRTPHATSTRVDWNCGADHAVAWLSYIAPVCGVPVTNTVRLTYDVETNDLPHLLFSVADTIHNNDDDDAGNGIDDLAESSSLVEDDELIPVSIGFDTAIPTNGVLTFTNPSGGLKFWSSPQKGTALAPPLSWNVSNETHAAVYAERAIGASGGADDLSLRLQWAVNGNMRQSAEMLLTAIEPVAEPIFDEWRSVNGTNNLYNPCCLVVGRDAWFKVRVTPESYPDAKIVWTAAEGEVDFIGGNTGRTVRVRPRTDTGPVTLEVRCGTCPTAPMQFHLSVRQPTTVKAYPFIVMKENSAGNVSTQDIAVQFVHANDIWRQVGLTIQPQPVSGIIDDRAADFDAKDNVECNHATSLTNGLDGIKVYFVQNLKNAAGFGSRYGIVIGGRHHTATLAHEIGHCYGLKDIYLSKTDKQNTNHTETVTGVTSKDRMTNNDWNNGTGTRYYNHGCLQETLIKRLIMFGGGSETKADIPAWFIEGVTYTNQTLDAYHCELVPVGAGNMRSRKPYLQE